MSSQESSEETGTGWPGDELKERYAKHLQSYFNLGPGKQLQMEGFVGQGVEGAAWKVKYTPPGGEMRRIVLKTELDAMLNFQGYDVKLGAQDPVHLDTAEKQVMRRLKWARHFCQIIDIDRDPLNQKWPHLLPHHNKSHFYMEWIPNGTLRNFVDQVKAAEIKFLPNRLLWRFFLCLIRSNIGLQWPPGKPPGGAPVLETVGTEANRRTILHQDVHMRNIMVDDFRPNNDREHDIFPALKLIDFGGAEEIGFNTEINNLRALGETMVNIILMDHKWDLHTDPPVPAYRENGKPYSTLAGIILPNPKTGEDPMPKVDGELRQWVAELCGDFGDSEDSGDSEDDIYDAIKPPTLQRLLDAAMQGIRRYEGQKYKDSDPESNQYIRGLLERFLFNAPRP